MSASFVKLPSWLRYPPDALKALMHDGKAPEYAIVLATCSLHCVGSVDLAKHLDKASRCLELQDAICAHVRMSASPSEILYMCDQWVAVEQAHAEFQSAHSV